MRGGPIRIFDDETGPSRLVRSVLWIVGFALFAGCAGIHPDPNSMREAPLEIDGPSVLSLKATNCPVISVVLDGRPARPFLLDTGSSITLIDARRAAEFGLDSRPYSNGYDLTGSGGETVRIDRYVHVERMRIGGLTVRDADVALLDDRAFADTEIDGILGQDFLARLTWIVDMQRRELHILPRGGDEALREYLASASIGEGSWIRLEADFQPCPFLPLSVSGLARDLEIEVDTGAVMTSLPQAAIDALQLGSIGTRLSGSIGGRYSSSLYRLERFPLFGLQIDADVGVAPGEHGLLGMDVLGRQVFVIDGPAHTIWLQHRE